MSNPIETQIEKSEQRLRIAMCQSDVNALNELLAPELIFTNHLGQVMTKQDDLEAHRSGIVKIETITLLEEHLLFIGDVAIVSVRVRLSGSYAGVKSGSDFRFTRIWALSTGGGWHVVAGHSSVVA